MDQKIGWAAVAVGLIVAFVKLFRVLAARVAGELSFVEGLGELGVVLVITLGTLLLAAALVYRAK